MGKPTADELTLVNEIFHPEDPAKVAISAWGLTQNLIGRMDLPSSTIQYILSLVDTGYNNRLLKSQVVDATRLFGHARQGQVVSATTFKSLLNTPAPLPIIEGLNPSVYWEQLPEPTTDIRELFVDQFFQSCTRIGRFTGADALELYGSSPLSKELLAKIWDLADNQDRGWLDLEHFLVFAYFVNGVQADVIHALPFTVPPELCRWAANSSDGSLWKKWYFYPYEGGNMLNE